MLWTSLLSILSVTAASGAALGAALGLTGLLILHFFVGNATSLALDAVWNTFNSFTLSAIPLFIILGACPRMPFCPNSSEFPKK